MIKTHYNHNQGNFKFHYFPLCHSSPSLSPTLKYGIWSCHKINEKLKHLKAFNVSKKEKIVLKADINIEMNKNKESIINTHFERFKYTFIHFIKLSK